MVKMTWS